EEPTLRTEGRAAVRRTAPADHDGGDAVRQRHHIGRAGREAAVIRGQRGEVAHDALLLIRCDAGDGPGFSVAFGVAFRILPAGTVAAAPGFGDVERTVEAEGHPPRIVEPL